jgi:hypothetical protein
VRQTFPVGGPIAIEVDQLAGRLRLDLTGEADTATVEADTIQTGRAGWIDDMLAAVTDDAAHYGARAAEQVSVRFDPARDDGTDTPGRLAVDTRGAAHGWRHRYDVRITAPARSTVSASTQSADIELDGVAGGLRVRSTSGRVRAGAIAGNAVVKTISGDVSISDARAGRLRVESVSGDALIAIHSGVGSTIALTSVSGRLHSDLPVRDRGDAADGLDIAVRTVSGDVILRRADVAVDP